MGIIIVCCIILIGVAESALIFCMMLFGGGLAIGGAAESDTGQDVLGTIGNAWNWTFDTALPTLWFIIVLAIVIALQYGVFSIWRRLGFAFDHPLAGTILTPIILAIVPGLALQQGLFWMRGGIKSMAIVYGISILIALYDFLYLGKDFFDTVENVYQNPAAIASHDATPPQPPEIPRTDSGQVMADPAATRPLPPVPPPPADLRSGNLR